MKFKLKDLWCDLEEKIQWCTGKTDSCTESGPVLLEEETLKGKLGNKISNPSSDKYTSLSWGTAYIYFEGHWGIPKLT